MGAEVFNEARGAQRLHWWFRRLAARSLQRQFCHTLVCPTCFPVLILAASAADPHFNFSFSRLFISIHTVQSFYSPSHHRIPRLTCIVSTSFFCTVWSCSSTVPASVSAPLPPHQAPSCQDDERVLHHGSLCIAHQPNNHFLFHLLVRTRDRKQSRTSWSWRAFKRCDFKGTWRGQGNHDVNPVEENILGKQACGIAPSQSARRGNCFICSALSCCFCNLAFLQD